jgi:hypothetical protein
MPTPSADFLRGASVPGDPSAAPPDESAVLMALGAGAFDISLLASRLGTTPEVVERVVGQLVRDGLIESGEAGLALTASGERALKYAYVGR